MALRSFVFFHRGGESFAVDVRHVRRVVRNPALRRLPAAPAFVAGGSRLDDRLEVMVDPAMLFGGVVTDETETPTADVVATAADVFGADSPDTYSRAVLVEVDGKPLGLLADQVEDVAEVEEAELRPPPPFVGGERRDAVVSVLARGRRDVLVLDLDRLLTGAELSEIPVSD